MPNKSKRRPVETSKIETFLFAGLSSQTTVSYRHKGAGLHLPNALTFAIAKHSLPLHTLTRSMYAYMQLVAYHVPLLTRTPDEILRRTSEVNLVAKKILPLIDGWRPAKKIAIDAEILLDLVLLELEKLL